MVCESWSYNLFVLEPRLLNQVDWSLVNVPSKRENEKALHAAHMVEYLIVARLPGQHSLHYYKCL